jgi:hypothetical protein
MVSMGINTFVPCGDVDIGLRHLSGKGFHRYTAFQDGGIRYKNSNLSQNNSNKVQRIKKICKSKVYINHLLKLFFKRYLIIDFVMLYVLIVESHCVEQ